MPQVTALIVSAALVGIGLLLAPWLPGSVGAWWALVVGCAGLASVGPSGGWEGPRGALVALVLGVAASRGIAPGPTLQGDVSVVGVRVGAALGRAGDVRVGRWAPPSGAWRSAEGRVRVRFPGPPPPAGTPVVVQGVASEVPPALPGAPDPVRAARLSGIQTQVVAREVAPLMPLPTLRPAKDETGLLAAVALGDRSGVSRDTLQVLRRTGTAHLLAISGFHVGVVAALAAGVAFLALRAVAVWRPAGVPTSFAPLIGVGAAFGYAQLAGAPLSAQRAAGLLGLAAVGHVIGRRTRPIPLLALVAVVIGVTDPSALATPGFQLSFGAVLGLVVFGARLTAWIPPDLPRPVAWVAQGTVATVSSTLGTLPAAAWWFQQVAPLSPVANLIAMPLMGFGIVPLAGVATFAPAPVDEWAGTVGTWLTQLMLWMLRPCAVDPWTPAVGPIGALLLAVGLWVSTWRVLPGLGIVVATLLWRPPRHDGLRVTVLDVGQGDATLVEYPDGRRWLVDGGPWPGAVLGWLRRQGIRHLDVVVATHGEWDHYAGLLPVLTELSVGELWANDLPDLLQEAAEEGGVSVRPPPHAVWPPHDVESRWSQNNRSIVLEVGPVLLTGDVERRAEAAMPVRPMPVLKVAHHGANTSSSPGFLAAVRPSLAIISAGRGNPYGHPHAAVLDRLEDQGVLVLRTDRDGTIQVMVHKGEITWQTARGRSGRLAERQ